METTVAKSTFKSIAAELSVNAKSEFKSTDAELKKNAKEEIFGKKVGFFVRVFGCKHKRMSKPVTTENTTYKYCPNCGIRRGYDLETFKFQGAFYYPPIIKELYHV